MALRNKLDVERKKLHERAARLREIEEETKAAKEAEARRQRGVRPRRRSSVHGCNKRMRRNSKPVEEAFEYPQIAVLSTLLKEARAKAKKTVNANARKAAKSKRNARKKKGEKRKRK